MNLRGKLATLEKAAGKVALSNIKRMNTEQLEATLLHGLEMEAQRASTPEHAELIRKTAAYLMSGAGLQDKDAPKLLIGALQNTVKLEDIPE